MTSLSGLLLLTLLSGGRDIAIPAGNGELRFSDVRAWRFSEARGEYIPALAAALDNRSGRDWESIRLRVSSDCAEGRQAYEVHVKRVRAGSQEITETAFDAIGAVRACPDAPVSVEWVDGVPGPVPTYAVIGFAQSFGESGWSTDLEGILDHRRPSLASSSTVHRFWRDGGLKLMERRGADPIAFYAIRVEPGEFGLAGFTLSRDTQDTGSLARFLRFYQLDPGRASYLGTFRVFRGQGQETGVQLEFDQEAFELIRRDGVGGLEVIAVPGKKPAIQSTSTLGK